MTEKKQQNVFVPIHVRLRSPAEQAQSENEHPASNSSTYHSTIPHPAQDSMIVPLPRGTESAQRTQQIKELIRLGNILRAELGLDEVLQQVVASISTCTGFRIAVINLVKDDSDYLVGTAFIGASEESERIIRERHISVEQVLRMMRPEFSVS